MLLFLSHPAHGLNLWKMTRLGLCRSCWACGFLGFSLTKGLCSLSGAGGQDWKSTSMLRITVVQEKFDGKDACLHKLCGFENHNFGWFLTALQNFDRNSVLVVLVSRIWCTLACRTWLVIFVFASRGHRSPLALWHCQSYSLTLPFPVSELSAPCWLCHQWE